MFKKLFPSKEMFINTPYDIIRDLDLSILNLNKNGRVPKRVNRFTRQTMGLDLAHQL